MKLRYVSDIHLEFMNSRQIDHCIRQLSPISDEVLILAGDIGNPCHQHYETFLDHVNRNFRKTFLLAGNHEYYKHGRTVDEVNRYIQSLLKGYPTISFLQNSCELFEGVNFIGTTLWSEVTNPHITINDTKLIHGMTPNTYQNHHMECRAFLEEALQSSPIEQNVILTHHMPSYDLIDLQYRRGSMEQYNQWFATDLNDWIETNNKRIKCWIYGHTHSPSERMLSGVPMLCNPIGYPGEQGTVNYCKQFLIE